jgi:hypothetical protein
MTALSGDDVLALWTARERVPEGAVLAAPVRRLLERSPEQHGINHKVFRVVEDAPLRAAAEATARLLNDAPGSDERVAAYLRGTYAALRSLLGGDGRHLLIDNDPGVTAAIGQHLAADAHTTFIAVIRDPSDQYIDRRAKAESSEPVAVNILRTARSARQRRRELDALAALAARRPERLLVVTFERFVKDAEYRERFFARLLGTPAPAESATNRFVPERSARNVGLAVRPKDRIQRTLFLRACEPSYRRAAASADGEAWPELAINDNR